MCNCNFSHSYIDNIVVSPSLPPLSFYFHFCEKIKIYMFICTSAGAMQMQKKNASFECLKKKFDVTPFKYRLLFQLLPDIFCFFLNLIRYFCFALVWLNAFCQYLCYTFYLTWNMWDYGMISVRPADRPIVRMWQKLKHCEFLGHYNYDKCQTVHDGSTHWTLPIHTTFSDFDCISRSQQCQTVLTENFMFLSK